MKGLFAAVMSVLVVKSARFKSVVAGAATKFAGIIPLCALLSSSRHSSR